MRRAIAWAIVTRPARAVVAIAGFLFVPSPLQKWAVERGASLATGRQVTFGDPFRLRAWPPLAITAADIRSRQCRLGQSEELARIEAWMPASTSWRSGAKIGSRSTG